MEASRESVPCDDEGGCQMCGNIGGTCPLILSVRGGGMSVMKHGGEILVTVFGLDGDVFDWQLVESAGSAGILSEGGFWSCHLEQWC